MKHFFSDSFHIVLAKGKKPSKQLFASLNQISDQLICCDGAARFALKNNFTPDLVIGDLDSARKCDLELTKNLFVDDQNTNDLEKALSFCQKHKLHNLIVLGALGKRLDHQLTNLHVVKKFSNNLNILLVSDKEIAFVSPNERELIFNHAKDHYVSLVPLEENVGPIFFQGVTYELNNEFLCAQSRYGTLNKFCKDQARLKVLRKKLLVIVPRFFLEQFI